MVLQLLEPGQECFVAIHRSSVARQGAGSDHVALASRNHTAKYQIMAVHQRMAGDAIAWQKP